MKPYRDYPYASISMHDSEELRVLLRDVILRENIQHVVETGTHEGLGSTRFLAEVFAEHKPPKSFLTIEANWHSWRRARRNLRRFPFVQPVWGQSLELRRALEFVQQDDCVRHHERYPDVFIDDVSDPVAFYTHELQGDLGGRPRGLRRLRRALERRFHYAGEDLLARSLRRVADRQPLVVLDSAGGTGWFEFGVLVRTMGDRDFVLLLDDVHHLKHFRSLAHVRRDPTFEILALDALHGWMLAKHSGGVINSCGATLGSLPLPRPVNMSR